ncbi:hypothetical protein [Brevibacillus borstelensis]|uniref:hypothetical protein n=1 Tax=Brevibacillus borstelensis TaxID=45462 RepID=UPI0004F28E97|nr:hypothetical protein [Brevibacillus borstelensis]KKX56346.1 hypothetical protein X546_04465 [Brevibacillus borstelensis cifa_chp40]
MEKDLLTVVQLVHAAYPSITIITDLEEWLAGNFKPPCAFIQTQAVTERGNTLTSYKILADAGIVLHHPKVKGIYQPISSEPFRSLLRREKYSFRGTAEALYIDIDNETLEIDSEKKDRTEITFRFEYRVSIPRPEVTKINTFEVEMEG